MQELAAVLGVDVLQLLAPGTPVTLVTPRAPEAAPRTTSLPRWASAAVSTPPSSRVSVPETAALAAALHTSVDQVRRALPPSPA
ncbi:hypothetical protein O3Q52_28535 [Streptomyces sp. ActVer]|uniref:hypothetical protein n=1 Tax=Streptomyces sp. ActVer TaxID=3014558 RepID=UPI0022B2C324|nr:hypothetical protein [Streptomyces sp. ActVer]MCZ4512051.1 hypothetical protein [Streptomyces sp. ActVer]